MKESLCVFDCETIPCVESLKKAFPNEYESILKKYEDSVDENKINYEFSDLIQNRQLEKTGSSFLPVNFHKIVAISVVFGDEYGKFVRVAQIPGNEKEMIKNFFMVMKKNMRLVSFNGRGFDLPMMMIRAMRYNLSIPAYFEIENKELNKSKWDGNYKSRYDGKFHLDLMDHISEFGSVRGLNLNSLCLSLNLPGKFDTHGDEVMELFYNDELEKIQIYCQSDVLNTYLLFLKYELLKGNINLEDYASFILGVKEYLNSEKQGINYTPVFTKCIDEEMKRCKIEI